MQYLKSQSRAEQIYELSSLDSIDRNDYKNISVTYLHKMCTKC